MSFQPPQGTDSTRGKIAIPRLERNTVASGRASGSKQRVQRACLTCRARKIKCNGGQPRCHNCLQNPQACVYASSRKDRLKTANEQNNDMAQLLKDLRPFVPDAERERIEDMLISLNEGIDPTGTSSKSPKASDPDQDERGEAHVSAEVGSNDDLDMVDEDLLGTDQSKATGYMGKNSDVQWLRRLHYEVDHHGAGDETSEGPFGPPGASPHAEAERVRAMKERQSKNVPLITAHSVNYYLDDEAIEMDFMAAPLELPPFETAERLLQCYLETVHNSFPILSKKIFVSQFYHYYSSLGRGMAYHLPQKWRAILNLVFAIGSVYSHLTEMEWRGDERDHLIYHSRAWSLSLKDPWWFSHPDMPQVQITGLLGVYYLAIGHVNRSWTSIGMALRFGYSLGLHIRNEDRKSSPVKKETLSRVWWAVYSLERIISSFTGRPSVGVEHDCSVPLPLPLSTEELEDAIIMSRFGDPSSQPSGTFKIWDDRSPMSSSSADQGSEDPANSGSFLKATVQVGIITQRVLLGIYSAGATVKSWEEIQKEMVNRNLELEAWVSVLPGGLSPTRPAIDPNLRRERNTLALYYHSTRILISRPCLCRLDRRIDAQSVKSSNFNRRTAESCVGSAKVIADLLPDPAMDGHPMGIYYFGPWWSMVHYIMQALVILLLETACGEAKSLQDRNETVEPVKKLVGALVTMKANNGMARRAYNIAIDVMKKMRATIPGDISDLLKEAEDTPELAAAGQPEPYLTLGTEYVHNPMGTAQPELGGQFAFSQAAFSQPAFPQPAFTQPAFSQPAFSQPALPSNNDSLGGDTYHSSFPFEDFLLKSSPSEQPHANLFVTDFDQQNPFNVDMGDVDMPRFSNLPQGWN